MLVLCNWDKTLLVTQINSEITLNHYHPDGSYLHRYDEDYIDFEINIGSSIYDSYWTFSPSSEYWDVKPPLRNSVIRFIISSENLELEEYDGEDVYLHTSFSNGPGYYLGWKKEKGIDRSTYIKSVILQ